MHELTELPRVPRTFAALTFIGYAVGAPLGSVLAMLPGGVRAPFFVGSILSIGIAIFIAWYMPAEAIVKAEREASEREQDGNAHEAAPDAEVSTSASTPSGPPPAAKTTEGLYKGAVPLLWVWCIYFALTCAGIPAYFLVVLPLFLLDMFGQGIKTYALITAVYTGVAGLVQWYALRPSVDLAGGSRLLVASFFSVTGAAGAVLLVIATLYFETEPMTRVAIFAAGLSLNIAARGFTTGITQPAMSALGDTSVQGRLMGLNSGIEVAGRLLGQIIIAFLYDASPPYACVFMATMQVLAAASTFIGLAFERAMGFGSSMALI